MNESIEEIFEIFGSSDIIIIIMQIQYNGIIHT